MLMQQQLLILPRKRAVLLHKQIAVHASSGETLIPLCSCSDPLSSEQKS
jgi:hypothetical protein